MLPTMVIIGLDKFAFLCKLLPTCQLLLDNQVFQGIQPVFVVTLTSVKFAPLLRFAKLSTQSLSPLLPRDLILPQRA